MAKGKTTNDAEMKITPLMRGTVKIRIIGTTPLFQNAMSAKVMQGLLLGGGKKSAAERKEIKHAPFEEFRDSMEPVPNGPTAVGLRVVAVKSAMCNAAVETAGATKAGAQRLIYMPGDLCPLYGTPQLRMDVTRSADMNRTPDVRTRAYFPKWGAEIEISYIIPQLSANAVVTLLCNAGVLIGVGDFRQEKGKGSFGLFRVVSPDEKDADWDELVKNHGRKAQEKAIVQPEYADAETAKLMDAYLDEVGRRKEQNVRIVSNVGNGNGHTNGKESPTARRERAIDKARKSMVKELKS